MYYVIITPTVFKITYKPTIICIIILCVLHINTAYDMVGNKLSLEVYITASNGCVLVCNDNNDI